MTRTRPTTNWNRNRYTFGITDIHGDLLVDINGDTIMAITDTNPLETLWT